LGAHLFWLIQTMAGVLPFRPWNVANQSTGDDKNSSKGQKRNASLIGGGATIQGLVQNYQYRKRPRLIAQSRTERSP